jgi:N-acetylglucosaminyldiphosphoundecaprenol N-acetyl-beta-D-mannosaminyltransferase
MEGIIMERVSILGVKIENVSLNEAVDRIEMMIKERESCLVVTANPEIILLTEKDQDFARCIDRAKMVTADGIGIVIASKLIGQPLKQRVAGIDMVSELFSRAQNKKYRFYLVGAKPGVADKAAENIKKTFPGIEIVGIQHGYFKDDSEIIQDIMEKKPDILLAALGMGKQEKWIIDRIFHAGVPVSIGVGGSLDVFAGEAQRAPVWMQKAGLEWFYRLLKQPSRYERMLQLPLFLFKVVCRNYRS